MAKRISARIAWLVAGTMVLCLTAPAVRAQKSAEKAEEDRVAFRESVVAIRQQIDNTLSALNGIVEGKDADAQKSALKRYDSEMKKMSSQIDKTRDYAKKMKERGQAYFKEWEKNMKSVTNEALKASATQRRTALEAQYQKIEAGMEEAKEDSATLWKNLQDLQKYYATDMSPDAITASAELVAATNADGKKVQGYIDQVIAAVDRVGSEFEAAQEGEELPPDSEEHGG